jgi:hypothetical protein
MSVHAQLEAANRRFAPRKRIRLGSPSKSLGQDLLIHDISSTGFLLETGAKLKAYDRLEVDLPEAGSREAIVVWTSGRFFGCQFAKPISRAAVSASLLRSPATDAAPAARVALPQGRSEDDEDEGVRDGELSFATKMRVILGASIVLWSLIFWAIRTLV